MHLCGILSYSREWKRIAFLSGNNFKILDSWDKTTKFIPELLLGLEIFKHWALILKWKIKNNTDFM